MHFILPFVALLLLGLDEKKAFLMGLLGIVPDLDVLFLYHRTLSHSVVVIGLFCLPFILYCWRVRPHRLGDSWLCFLVLASNPLLDVFFGFTPVLWPLYPYAVSLRMGLNIHIGKESTLSPFLDFDRIHADFNQRLFIEGSLFTNESVIITLIFMMPIVYRRLAKAIR